MHLLVIKKLLYLIGFAIAREFFKQKPIPYDKYVLKFTILFIPSYLYSFLNKMIKLQATTLSWLVFQNVHI